MEYDFKNLFTDIEILVSELNKKYNESNLFSKIKLHFQILIFIHKLTKIVKRINAVNYDLMYSFAYFLENKCSDKCTVSITYYNNKKDTIKLQLIDKDSYVNIELQNENEKKFRISTYLKDSKFNYYNTHYDTMQYYNNFDKISSSIIIKNIKEFTISYINNIFTYR